MSHQGGQGGVCVLIYAHPLIWFSWLGMSPERAEDIFYTCYRDGRWGEVDKPLVQVELRMRCWQAVIDEMEREFVERLALKYLEGRGCE